MKELSEILNNYSPDRENLIGILHDIQNNNPQNFISAEDMKMVADYLKITRSQVYGVVTYYTMFSAEPRGKYIIRVCSSPICEMTRSEGILAMLESKIRVKRGETTPDGLFTVETCECLGHCEEAPCMIINDEFYGNLDRDKLDAIIDGLS
jgi:NADH-quinone oxidoreductase E subunit